MILKELHLKNFGKFCDRQFEFEDGINIIYGANEAGKTTIYTAIGAMLFGMERKKGRAAKSDTYATYQPWEHKTWYEGKLKFETGGKRFCIERNFYQEEKEARLFCETDGEELSIEQGDMEMLLGDTGAELFFNTAAVGQLKMKPQEIVYGYLENYIAGLLENTNHSTDVTQALDILENKKKALERQQKQRQQEILQQLKETELKIRLTEEDILVHRQKLEQLQNGQKQEKVIPERKKQGLLARFFCWILKILGIRKEKKREKPQEGENAQTRESVKILREFLGEKESQREEFLLEKDALYEELHEVSKSGETEAVEMAIQKIRELSVIGREEVFERLEQKASEVLSSMTQGKYQKLSLKEKEPEVWDGEKMRKLFQVSTGCADQVYLSVRIALQDLFFEEEKMPLLFDDAFAYFDDKRLERLLLYLAGIDRQILLFTCHTREMEILEKLQIPCGKITI